MGDENRIVTLLSDIGPKYVILVVSAKRQLTTKSIPLKIRQIAFSYLLLPDIICQNPAQYFLPLLAADRNPVGTDENLIPFDGVNLGPRNEEGFMYPNKGRRSQFRLYISQVQECNILPASRKNGDIIL